MSAEANVEKALRRAYDAGFAAAQRGEEAAPGCTANAAGHAYLRGYVEGRAALRDGRRASMFSRT
jgi:hypothetical protein